MGFPARLNMQGREQLREPDHGAPPRCELPIAAATGSLDRATTVWGYKQERKMEGNQKEHYTF